MTNKPAPKDIGRYVEANLDTISDGDLRREFEGLLREMHTRMLAHETTTGDLDAKIKATVSLVMHRDGEQFVRLEYDTVIKTPKVAHSAMIRQGGKRLLADLNGDGSLNDKDQLTLQPTFDRFGGERAAINTETGEAVVDGDAADDGVAGSIGSAG